MMQWIITNMFAGPTTDMQIRVSRQAEIFGPGRLELGIGNRQPQHELSQPAALALGEVGPERQHCGCRLFIRPGQAACWYSWRVPPSRSCRRISMRVIWRSRWWS